MIKAVKREKCQWSGYLCKKGQQMTKSDKLENMTNNTAAPETECEECGERPTVQRQEGGQFS